MIDLSKASSMLSKLKADAKAGGYLINSDDDFTLSLVEGMLTNVERYGYQACPCRLASGNIKEDMDIICPCDYRDADLTDFGACYCALYVSDEVASGKRELSSIPDRRLTEAGYAPKPEVGEVPFSGKALPYPVWRCRVCGYLCARETPPGICPICKAKSERFEKFI